MDEFLYKKNLDCRTPSAVTVQNQSQINFCIYVIGDFGILIRVENPELLEWRYSAVKSEFNPGFIRQGTK